MIELLSYDFEEHIEFILDCLDEASPYSWPDIERTPRVRNIDYNFLKKIYLDKHIIKILKDDKKLIGFIWYDFGYNRIEDIKYCHINFIYVIPEYRGKGLGKYLIDKIEEAASVQNCTEIKLDVTISNDSAVNLYREQGFKEKRYIMSKRV